MEISKVKLFPFSPCGGTSVVLDALAAGFPWPVEKHDLTRPSRPVSCTADELAVFGFPVYAGHPAPIAEGVFSIVTGNKTPAVLVAVYGNREYEQSFIDLDDLAKRRGFVPLAAVAGLAEHSMFPTVATGRPDQADASALGGFGSRIAEYVKTVDMGFRKTFNPPGKRIDPRQMPADLFTPSVKQESCTLCGACVRVCPTGAIPAAAPNTTIQDNCLWCMACIKYCPEKARLLANPMIPEFRRSMEESCASRLEPEVFF